jgi:hypothetical protein
VAGTGGVSLARQRMIRIQIMKISGSKLRTECCAGELTTPPWKQRNSANACRGTRYLNVRSATRVCSTRSATGGDAQPLPQRGGSIGDDHGMTGSGKPPAVDPDEPRI